MEEIRSAYRQQSHLRYIIDYYSSQNGRTIRNRKTYLISLGTGVLITAIGFWFLPSFREALTAILLLLIYFLAREIGRREGYIKAYESLLHYDETYLQRWQTQENNRRSDSEITLDAATRNIQKNLKDLDFDLKQP